MLPHLSCGDVKIYYISMSLSHYVSRNKRDIVPVVLSFQIKFSHFFCYDDAKASNQHRKHLMYVLIWSINTAIFWLQILYEYDFVYVCNQTKISINSAKERKKSDRETSRHICMCLLLLGVIRNKLLSMLVLTCIDRSTEYVSTLLETKRSKSTIIIWKSRRRRRIRKTIWRTQNHLIKNFECSFVGI